MKITEKLDSNGTSVIRLTDAPAKSVIEIRWQNTLSGATYVDVVETDDVGMATLVPPYTYGQGFVPKARILNDKTNALVSFSYADGSFVSTDQTPSITPNSVSTLPKGIS